MPKSELLNLKQAIVSMRQAFITKLDELENSIDILLPSEDPPATPRTYDINHLRALCDRSRPRKKQTRTKP